MRKLGVNIDHIATLRQARMEGIPDIIKAAAAVASGGADSITVHLRQDRRHINENDVFRLKSDALLPLNLEMAAVEEIRDIALKALPRSICIVPEKRKELTTEGGLDVAGNKERLEYFTAELKAAGIEVSMFVDPDPKQIKCSSECGADAIEIHTGMYANSSGDDKIYELEKIHNCVELGLRQGLKVNAGHGLNYENILPIRDIPGLNDLNIGYAIVCMSVFVGLEEAVRRMKDLIR